MVQISRLDILDMLDDPAQLSIALQPQVNLRSGCVESAEVLVRWNHPVWGAVPPARFVPLVIAMDQQGALFQRVARLALSAAHGLEAAGYRVPVSINACAATLSDPVNLAFLHAETNRRSINPSCLTVELTEDPAANPPALLTALQRLRCWGYRISLDDFGAGYANLNQLMSLPLDELKLDQTFASSLETSPVASQCVHFALALSQQMGWRLIAEGIATTAQLRALSHLGCHYGQGFLLGRPMPLDALMAHPQLRRHPAGNGLDNKVGICAI